MSVATHYHLGCFVTTGRTHPSPFEGWATFTRIFQARPDQFRFAVARELVLVNEGDGLASRLVHRLDDGWICWDLYDELLAKVPASGRFCPPAPLWRGPSEEALVMRAIHHG